jgi:hypothetical protein
MPTDDIQIQRACAHARLMFIRVLRRVCTERSVDIAARCAVMCRVMGTSGMGTAVRRKHWEKLLERGERAVREEGLFSWSVQARQSRDWDPSRKWADPDSNFSKTKENMYGYTTFGRLCFGVFLP